MKSATRALSQLSQHPTNTLSQTDEILLANECSTHTLLSHSDCSQMGINRACLSLNPTHCRLPTPLFLFLPSFFVLLSSAWLVRLFSSSHISRALLALLLRCPLLLRMSSARWFATAQTSLDLSCTQSKSIPHSNNTRTLSRIRFESLSSRLEIEAECGYVDNEEGRSDRSLNRTLNLSCCPTQLQRQRPPS